MAIRDVNAKVKIRRIDFIGVVSDTESDATGKAEVTARLPRCR
jgi:hypothetical protein